MSRELSNKDYITILKFYKMKIPKSRLALKKKAEDIMADKLCKCIKKVDPVYEAKSIGICSKTIFNNKGFKRGKFTCTGKRSAKIMKKEKNKTRKNKSDKIVSS